jgi:putative chitobiose transport system substrate-binding protein
VPRRGDTPEARARERLAAELAAFVTNGPNQLAFCRLVPILPSVVATARDPFFTQEDGTLEGKARVISARGLASAEVYLQPYPGMGELNAAMSTAIEKACLGQATPREALAEAAARWNAVFDAAHETQNADR